MSARAGVLKTYKLLINGQFVRSESGRAFEVRGAHGAFLANVAQASRKDLRDAVLAARKAQSGWAGRTAYNRGQILYRIAEMLESRREAFEHELQRATGISRAHAAREVSAAIDRWVYYAGWSDKWSALLSSLNPVAMPMHNFTLPEPVGVVGLVCPDVAPLASLTSLLAPVIVSGNTAVVLLSEMCIRDSLCGGAGDLRFARWRGEPAERLSGGTAAPPGAPCGGGRAEPVRCARRAACPI
jgi:acyl-CoA reductase-like NAD-dependent aldehyde dehydrogenase